MTSTFTHNDVPDKPAYPCLKENKDDKGASTIVLLTGPHAGVVVASESNSSYLAVGRWSHNWADNDPLAFKPFNGTVTLKG